MKQDDIINGRYKLIRLIGQGSFGEVWLAADQQVGINVAIKIYVALDAKGITEFRNEFKNVYNLHHSNLLRADYLDSVENRPFLVMPYCPVSVGNLVGRMNEDDILKFVKDVASGLAYLHEHDIIHRDIKPDNILQDEQGNYVITDFGLSTKMRSTLRKASGRHNNEAEGQSGTIGYMAPELFVSKPQAVKATDIWALGVSIYEIATGELPFCGQGGVMELHGAELPELPYTFSKKLAELVSKCLAKDTWDRPTAQDIIHLLEPKTVSYDTYMKEVNRLQSIIDSERSKNQQLQTQLSQQPKPAPSKSMKAWAWGATVIAILFISVSCYLSSEEEHWRSSYQEARSDYWKLYSESDSVRDEGANYKKILEGLLAEPYVLAFNIKVWNDGEPVNAPIHTANTTYIYHSAEFISNKFLNSADIYVKFIAPDGLRTGNINGKPSPKGYSYPQSLSLSPYSIGSLTSDGWGGKDKGHWPAGDYRIEYWYRGKCIGSKDFTILK